MSPRPTTRPLASGRVARRADEMIALFLAAVVAGLGSDDYATREAATATLTALAARAEPQLRRAAADEGSPEARRRAGRILSRLYAGRMARRLRGRPTPCLDMVLEGGIDDARLPGYLAAARLGTPATGHPLWLDYREATRLHLIDRAAAEWRADQDLRESWLREVAWYWHYYADPEPELL